MKRPILGSRTAEGTRYKYYIETDVLKLTTDRHEAWHIVSETAGLFVFITPFFLICVIM